jgi:hypothetical protein
MQIKKNRKTALIKVKSYLHGRFGIPENWLECSFVSGHETKEIRLEIISTRLSQLAPDVDAEVRSEIESILRQEQRKCSSIIIRPE